MMRVDINFVGYRRNMRIFVVALCFALASASEPSYYTGREFNFKDFTLNEPQINEEEAELLAAKQLDCNLYRYHCEPFASFGQFECITRVYTYENNNNDNIREEEYEDPTEEGYQNPKVEKQKDAMEAGHEDPGQKGDVDPKKEGQKYPGQEGDVDSKEEGQEYPGQARDEDSKEEDNATKQTKKTVPKTYEKKCREKYCFWLVKKAYSKCSGYVTLYKFFRACSSECPRDYDTEHGTYENTCGYYTGSGKCSCQTIFCVKSIYTAYYDKVNQLRKGYLQYKFPCKCGCRTTQVWF